MRVGLLFLAVTGCVGEDRFRIADASCGEAFTAWHEDLTFHILQGDGSGAFSYDPRGEARSKIGGSYSLNSGDFDWDVSYSDDHYLVSRSVEGGGVARTNGDLDIEYTVTSIDIADETYTTDVRYWRTGCDVTRWTALDGSDTDAVIEGTFAGGVFEYTETYPLSDGGELITTGERRSDLTYSESYDAEVDGVSYESSTEGDLATGYSRDDFVTTTSDYKQTGYSEDWRDGRRHVFFDVDYGSSGVETWDYEVDYFGNGEGTVSGDGYECAVDFDEYDCTYQCPGGNSGSC
jgi:hypothetical protein